MGASFICLHLRILHFCLHVESFQRRIESSPYGWCTLSKIFPPLWCVAMSVTFESLFIFFFHFPSLLVLSKIHRSKKLFHARRDQRLLKNFCDCTWIFREKRMNKFLLHGVLNKLSLQNPRRWNLDFINPVWLLLNWGKINLGSRGLYSRKYKMKTFIVDK